VLVVSTIRTQHMERQVWPLASGALHMKCRNASDIATMMAVIGLKFDDRQVEHMYTRWPPKGTARPNNGAADSISTTTPFPSSTPLLFDTFQGALVLATLVDPTY
jgi:hypothetical protein